LILVHYVDLLHTTMLLLLCLLLLSRGLLLCLPNEVNGHLLLLSCLDLDFICAILVHWKAIMREPRCCLLLLNLRRLCLSSHLLELWCSSWII